MIRHILKQLWAQRKYNTWIFIELLLVFVLVWVLADYAFISIHNRSIPRGFNTSNAYMVRYGIYGSETSRYNPVEDDSIKTMQNLDLFLQKIKFYKNVQTAALTCTSWGSTPFSGDNNQSAVINPEDTTKVIYPQLKNVFSGDYFRIFRYASSKDNSWERIANIDLRQNQTLFITKQVERAVFGNQSAIGKKVYADIGEGKREYIVAEVLNDQKRFDYILPYGAIFGPSELPNPNNLEEFAICLRTQPGVSERQFIADFRKEMTKPLQIGNFYLKEIQSFQSIKESTDYMFGITNEIRLRTILLIFFLFNIALGIIGTFWFRNQTRRGEIGLRMAMGSTSNKIEHQFITEALLLFTFAVIPAILINLAIAKADVIKLNMDIIMSYKTVKGSPYITQNAPLRFLITNGITYIFLSIVIILSAWIPANHASKVHPVDALHDE